MWLSLIAKTIPNHPESHPNRLKSSQIISSQYAITLLAALLVNIVDIVVLIVASKYTDATAGLPLFPVVYPQNNNEHLISPQPAQLSTPTYIDLHRALCRWPKLLDYLRCGSCASQDPQGKPPLSVFALTVLHFLLDPEKRVLRVALAYNTSTASSVTVRPLMTSAIDLSPLAQYASSEVVSEACENP